MSQPSDTLIGLYCLDAFCGYAGHLKLPFCKYPDKTEQFKNDPLEPKWELETISAAWRLTVNENLLTGSYEEQEHNDTHLKKVVGRKLLEITFQNRADLTLTFEDQYQIAIFSQGISFPVLEIYNLVNDSIRNVLFLDASGKWKEYEQKAFTDLEQIASKHADQCARRWKQILPKMALDNHCRDCAYFLPNRGRFYFWDFGLCSNGRSLFDGKVVGVKNSCEYFDDTLHP